MQAKFHLLATVLIFLILSNSNFAQAPDLGAGSTFALFTAAGAFNGDPATSVTGDIGTDVGAFTPPGFLVGQIHVSDPVSTQAAADVAIAYGFLASLTCGAVLSTPIGNSQILLPNVYCLGSASVLNADLILDGQGDPSSVFIFQIDGALSTNMFSRILLTNSANLCNVYWQINGAFNQGGNSTFQGTVIAAGAINLANGAVLIGRGLSTAGAISTSANTVTLPNSCLCVLDISCPSADGGTFQCIAQIPAGLPSDVTVNSACGTATVAITNTSSGAGCTASPYILTRTYTVSDVDGHTATCVVTYTAIDNIAPTISCPAPVTVQCVNLVPAPNTASVTVGADNCGGAPTVTFVGDVITNQICANQYTITRTYQVADACGNTATCSQTITVFDNTAPTITCPAPVTVQCASLVPAADPASVVTSDNCGGGVTVTFVGDVIINQTCANRYTITRTYQATDACGFTATCSQTITVLDNTAPTITCLAAVTVQCASLVPAADPAAIVTSDNCGGGATVTFVGDVISNQTCANRFTITRTYQATDACGNTATCSQVITVFDNTAPAISCPAPVTVQCASLVPAANTGSVTVGADNCGGTPTVSFVGDVISNQTCANRFTITRTYQVIDVCGNTATCSQIITVLDNTAPSITCPAPVTVQCASLVPAANTGSVTVGTDNCGGTPTVSFVGDVISNQTCANRFTITRTYQVIDICGNTATCSQVITVLDNTAPTISCPAPVTVQCANLVPVPNTTSVTVGTDNCGGTPTVTFVSDVITNQICANRYTITRTYQVADACGNTATCSQTITVFDNTAPTITCPPPVTVQCASLVPAADPAAVVTSDNCGGGVTVTFVGDVITNQTCANRYTITRTYQATDACGLSATCSQTITVFDNTAPTITCLAAVTVQCASLVPAANPAAVVTSDNCGGSATVTFVGDVISNQTCANRFTITRTYQATDACGNTATCSQVITVFDNTAPAITCPAPVTVQCANQVPAANTASVTVGADNCGGTPTVSFVGDVISNQSCANRFTITRTYQVIDVCGNTATCSQIITVLDNTAPTISCPAPVTVQCANLVPVPNIASVTVGADNCGGTTTVTFVSDVITNQICANRFTITRTYQVADACGNTATCAQIITVFDNTAPVFATLPNLTIDCYIVPPVVTPTAADNCTGTVTVTFLGEIQTPGVCPILYTLTRTWRAADDCGNSATVSQVITVTDTYAPQFTNDALDVVIECNIATNMDAFQDWLDNHGGAIVSDCSAITWTFEDSPFQLDTAGCASTFKRFIRFIATDACGNVSFQDAIFTVTDQTPPTFTVPPLNLEVECIDGDNGEAKLLDWIEHFGYAEVSDDCGAVHTELVFLSEIAGCGNTYKRFYQFRATDECGNTNYITATFAVIDTTPPLIVKCPPGNVFLTCEFDVPPPDIAGVLTLDNCGSVTVTYNTYSTGVGCVYSPKSISYWYMATDECGNMSSNCDQSFQVLDSIPPTYTGPDTLYVLCVEDLPGPGDAIDILAPYMVDNCYNIICFADAVAGNSPNSVTYCVKSKDLCANWTDKFLITFIATGGCKPLCSAPQSTWGDTAGSINGMNTTDAIENLIAEYGGLTAGKLGKTITVNSADCLQGMLPGNGTTNQFGLGNYAFGVDNNCQPNSPLLNTDGTLKNILAANVMAMQLNIWYNLKFNNRSLGVQLLATLPPCLVDPAVAAKVDADHPSIQGLLNISNDYLAGVGGFQPNFGNLLNDALDNLNKYWLNCQIAAQDPNALCATKVSVAGTLATEMHDGYQAGKMDITGQNPAGSSFHFYQPSDGQGKYQFSDAMPVFSNYNITPTTTDMAYLNGVTTYDLVLISKHIMGIEPLNSPYKMIAADVNKSGSITTFDVVELRKLILGVYQTLPENASWRFVDKSFVFPNQVNPFQTSFPENMTMANIQASQMNQDFVAVKIGDVNNSAAANIMQQSTDRTTGTLLVDIEDRMVQAGETFDVTFTPAETAQSLQFTLNLANLAVTEIVGGQRVSAENFGVFQDALTVSVDGAQAFTVRFKASKAAWVSELLNVSSRITKAEAYSQAGEREDVALRFNQGGTRTISGLGFELYQNEPNPFVDKTSIRFYLPESAAATLTVYDVSGRMVFTKKGDYARGYNTIAVERALLNTNGLLYYKVETATDMATRKMIQID